ncbi:MAG: TPM domain-containing protein [Spirochaetales bacterium]|nr:TPM domain-containing protein [Spirochaetales bacterium]
MKCPSCSEKVNDNVKECPACGFHMALLGKKIKQLPRKSGLLIDTADIIEEEYTNRLFHWLLHFQIETGIEFHIVTVPSSEALKPTEYVFYFLNHYNIGGNDHRGLVLMLFAKEKKLVCEVGYSLESLLSDEAANDILQHDAVPLLKKKKYGQALYIAANLLGDILQHGASRFKRFVHRAALQMQKGSAE